MSNLELKVSDGNKSETLRLVDAPGPLNTWCARAPDIFGPAATDTFTNLGGAVTGRGCGVVPCFTLEELDIDTAQIGDSGKGVLNYAGSELQSGNLNWIVTG